MKEKKGHFPGNPIVPGVIICEIMAQSCVLLIDNVPEGKLPVYAGLDKVRFKKMVRPGDTIVVKARLQAKKEDYYVLEAKATVDGQICCKGLLSIFLANDNQ